MNCASLSPISTACYPGILKHRCSSLDAHEQTILEEFEEHKLLMSDTLVFSKGGTECFADDILGMNGLELEDYIS